MALSWTLEKTLRLWAYHTSEESYIAMSASYLLSIDCLSMSFDESLGNMSGFSSMSMSALAKSASTCAMSS